MGRKNNMRVDIIDSKTLEDERRKALQLIPGTKEWTEARLDADKKLRQKLFIEKCKKLGISAVRVREEAVRTYVSISFYALVSEQEYGIQQDFEFDNEIETILDLTPKVIETTKVWNRQLIDLIQITAKAKGLL